MQKPPRRPSPWSLGAFLPTLAARFFDRSADTVAFKRGMAAHNNPEFYRQLGKEPEQIVGDALAVLAKRFGLG